MAQYFSYTISYNDENGIEQNIMLSNQDAFDKMQNELMDKGYTIKSTNVRARKLKGG